MTIAASWQIFGGIAFSDSGGSDLYARQFTRVMEYLRTDPQGDWRRWYNNSVHGDLVIVLTLRTGDDRGLTRVLTRGDFNEVRMGGSVSRYHGLDELGMLRDVCVLLMRAFTKLSQRLNLGDPPTTPDQLLMSVLYQGT